MNLFFFEEALFVLIINLDTAMKSCSWDFKWQGRKGRRYEFEIGSKLFLFFTSGLQAHYHIANHFESELHAKEKSKTQCYIFCCREKLMSNMKLSSPTQL